MEPLSSVGHCFAGALTVHSLVHTDQYLGVVLRCVLAFLSLITSLSSCSRVLGVALVSADA